MDPLEGYTEREITAFRIRELAFWGKVDELRAALETEIGRQCINDVDGTGNTALHLASGQGRQEAVQLLIESGADIEKQNNRGNTPLHTAAEYGAGNIVDILVGRDATIDARNNERKTPLMLASQSGSNGAATRLILRGANMELTDNDGSRALLIAIRFGNEETAKLLIEAGATLETNYDARAAIILGRLIEEMGGLAGVEQKRIKWRESHFMGSHTKSASKRAALPSWLARFPHMSNALL